MIDQLQPSEQALKFARRYVIVDEAESGGVAVINLSIFGENIATFDITQCSSEMVDRVRDRMNQYAYRRLCRIAFALEEYATQQPPKEQP